MIESRVPTHFWPQAIAATTYFSNRLPHKKLNHKTPLNTLRNLISVPYTHSLPPRVFESIVYVHLPKHSHNKLEARAIKCVFLGYGTNQKGYRCYDPSTRRVVTTLDCDFFENSFYYHLSRQGETNDDDLS